MEHILAVGKQWQFGVCPMKCQHKGRGGGCPATVKLAAADARAAFDKAAEFCQSSEVSFWQFEKQLFVLMASVGVCLIRLFFRARQQRLDVQPFLQDGKYRLGDEQARRTL